jgi:hypothetical protein
MTKKECMFNATYTDLIFNQTYVSAYLYFGDKGTFCMKVPFIIDQD